MKKIISIPLLIIYSLLTIGLYFNAHFCGEELSSFKLFAKADKMCGCSDDEEMGDCCKDVSAYFKIKDDHQTKSASFDFYNSFCFQVFSKPQNVFALNYYRSEFISCKVNPPPVLYAGIPLNLINRVLLI